MPIDSSVPLEALGGLQRAQPFNPMATLGDLAQLQNYRAMMEERQARARMLQQNEQEDADIQSLAQQYPDDHDTFIKALYGRGYAGKAAAYEKLLNDGRRSAAEAHKSQIEAERAGIDAGLRTLSSVRDDGQYQIVRRGIVGDSKELDALLPKVFTSQDDLQPAYSMGLSLKDWQDNELKAAQYAIDGKTQDAIAQLYSRADNQVKWDRAADLAKQAGAAGIAAQYGPQWTPEAQKLAAAHLAQPTKPEKAAAVGSFEDYVLRTYGPNPSPEQILKARKAYGQADDRQPTVRVSVGAPSALGVKGLDPKTAGDFSIALGRVTATMPAIRKKGVLDTANQIAATGDTEQLKSFLRQLAIENENVDTRRQVEGRQNAVAALRDIRGMLQELKRAGVDTNILRGEAEDIARKLGTSTDTRLAEVGTRLKDALVEYRRSMTGVQFSVPEANDYAKMFPNYQNTLPLNEAILNGLERGMMTRDRLFWTRKLGDKGAELVGALPPSAAPPPAETPAGGGKKRYKFDAKGNLTSQ